MNKQLSFARCGLACCLCSENDHCSGCTSGDCPDRDWCFNRKCSMEKGIESCAMCSDLECRKGMLGKIKPLGFTEFIRRYGKEELLRCLEINEKKGVVYHRQGVMGDYDAFDNVEDLIRFILSAD